MRNKLINRFTHESKRQKMMMTVMRHSLTTAGGEEETSTAAAAAAATAAVLPELLGCHRDIGIRDRDIRPPLPANAWLPSILVSNWLEQEVTLLATANHVPRSSA
ncbi:hypothetical protein JOB18_034678 [Solea senegalensis]|uniref:Uncharacterized protein n=1 Tax=Solea senegalensis TaxID=28829 RepID=A0AAV6RCU5_SOLSE|nr:hypothetical protein JOB18_034678 [Solea senegalensis]